MTVFHETSAGREDAIVRALERHGTMSHDELAVYLGRPYVMPEVNSLFRRKKIRSVKGGDGVWRWSLR